MEHLRLSACSKIPVVSFVMEIGFMEQLLLTIVLPGLLELYRKGRIGVLIETALYVILAENGLFGILVKLVLFRGMNHELVDRYSS